MPINDAMVAEAAALGEAAAKAAASWATDGNADVAERGRVLEMLRAGDPAAWDALPREPNLSGEYADNPTPRSVAADVGLDPDADGEEISALADAWEEAVSEHFGPACEAELIRFCEPSEEPAR